MKVFALLALLSLAQAFPLRSGSDSSRVKRSETTTSSTTNQTVQIVTGQGQCLGIPWYGNITAGLTVSSVPCNQLASCWIAPQINATGPIVLQGNPNLGIGTPGAIDTGSPLEVIDLSTSAGQDLPEFTLFGNGSFAYETLNQCLDDGGQNGAQTSACIAGTFSQVFAFLPCYPSVVTTTVTATQTESLTATVTDYVTATVTA